MLAWFLRRPACALALALLVETALFAAAQGDFNASDPLAYAEKAREIAESPSTAFAVMSNHPFDMRIGLTVPLAGLYRVFGVALWVTNLPALLAALGVLWIVYAAAPTARAKLIGLGLGVACTPLLRQAMILNPDLPCAALMGCSILWLARRDGPHGARWAAGAMAVWFAAFLVKESALWVAPVWIYALVCDLRASGWRAAVRTFAPAILLGAALAAAYLALCAIVWRDPFARFAGVQALAHAHAWSLENQPASAWIERLTWEPPLVLAKLFKLTLLPAVLAPWLMRGAGPRVRIWGFATPAILLLFWFGSSSSTSYSPLPLAPRMLMPVVPGLLVLAAFGADAAFERLRGSAWRYVAAGVLAAALVLQVLSIRLTIARPRPLTAAFAALRAEAAASPRDLVLVCVDAQTTALCRFYFGFPPPPHVRVVAAPEFAQAPPPPAHARVRALVAGIEIPLEPSRRTIAQIDALGLPALVQRGKLHLSDAGDGARLHAALRAAQP